MKNYEVIFRAAEAMDLDYLLNQNVVVLAAQVIERLQDALMHSQEREENAAAEIKRLGVRIGELEKEWPSHSATEFVRNELRYNPAILNSIGAGLFTALALNYPDKKIEFVKAVRAATNWGLRDALQLANFIWG